MKYCLQLRQPLDNNSVRLEQYHPDSFKDYLQDHFKHVCCGGTQQCNSNCKALKAMPEIATSMGIVSPPRTMSRIYCEYCY